MAEKTVEELARGLVEILREEGGVAWRDKLIHRLQKSEQVFRNDAFYALTYARSEGLIEHVHNEQWYPATMRLPGEKRSKPEDLVEAEAEVEEKPELTPAQEGLAKLVAERRAEQQELRETFEAAESYLQFVGEPFLERELIRALQGILGVSRSRASDAAVHLVDAGFATKSYADGTLTPMGYINPEDEVQGYGEYAVQEENFTVEPGSSLSWLMGSEGSQGSGQGAPEASKPSPEVQDDPSGQGQPWWVERHAHIAPDLLPDEDFLIRGFVARNGEASAELHSDGTDYTASLLPDDHSKRFRLQSASLGFDAPFFDEIFIFTEDELNPELVQEYLEDYRLGKLTETEQGWKR